MKLDCRNFRAALELALAGESRALSALAWHEHLAGCGECRALLEAEEALELLLASLPDPRLPRRLAERVLVRLRASRRAEVQLDALLALVPADDAPTGLAARVLAGLAAERAGTLAADAEHDDAGLERLLAESGHVAAPLDIAPRVLARVREAEAEQDRRLERVLDRTEALAPVEVPAQLAARVLAGLATVRAAGEAAPAARATTDTAAGARSAVSRATPRARRSFVLALAASLVLALAVWGLALLRQAPDATPIVRPPERGTRAPADDASGRGATSDPNAPNPEMLAALEVLEQWDLLMTDDVDVLLSTFTPADQALLDLRAFDDAAAPVEENSGEGTNGGPKPKPKSVEGQKG